MAIVIQGMTPEGEYVKIRTDADGNLAAKSAASFVEGWSVIAGSSSTYGKIGTVANTAKVYVALDCDDFPVTGVDWAITSDQQYTYQLFRSHQNELTATITFTDATAVDAGDTCIVNGLTFTAHADTTTAATRNYSIGASNAEAAANLTALLTHATYGVPGILAVAGPVAATDVITITSTTATALHFEQGTSAANEIAWADTTLANLWIHAVASGNTAANAVTSRGLIVNQSLVNGWEWCFLCLTNTSGGAAATFNVRAIRY